MLTAFIAVDKATLSFDKLFSYKVPTQYENIITAGSIALVPFGKGDKLRMGIVLQLSDIPSDKKIKELIDVKNQELTITEYTLSLIHHLKETTFCTYYEAVRSVVPYGGLYKIIDGRLVDGYTQPTRTVYTATAELDGEIYDNLTQKQKTVYSYLMNEKKTIQEISLACAVSSGVVDALVKKQAVYSLKEPLIASDYDDIEHCAREISLSIEQQTVVENILKAEDTKPHLIHGVTSSGKSMVFLKLIEQVLLSSGSAMVLVPEISLTPQMIRLLKQQFGDIVAVIHSKLSKAKRMAQYNAIAQGISRVVVGTRSAVFSPMKNLKLIVIDEEHEKTFKSESNVRYSAIRVAAFVAKQQGARLVLASATPSVESYYLAENGFYHLHKMPTRYNNMSMPSVEIIDMRLQAQVGDTGPISRVVLKYLLENIQDEKQSIILLNRRGYATLGVCKECRTTLECSECSVNLVKHKQIEQLSCHYCGKSYPIVSICPKCGGEIQYIGYGTQRLEEYIQEAIPSAKILRMDADTTQKSDSHSEMLQMFAREEYNILIGTQMVAKGLDFKAVSLVVVLGIDGALNQLSYNGSETAFNLLTQVIGRAGRFSENSRAVVQTYDGENGIIALAQSGDYNGYYQREIAYRNINIYPPFCTLCMVGFTHEKELTAHNDAQRFLQIIKELSLTVKNMPLIALGPAPFTVLMVNKAYRYRLTLKCKNTKQFREFLQRCCNRYLLDKQNKSEIYINLNPVQD